MSREIAIKLKGVSKYYKLYNASRDRLKEVLHPFGKKYHRNYFALKNVDLEVYKGEILGIVGRNGSGKSTLLKIVTGVLYPNEGQVTVNGRISALLELGTGFNPDFTGLENIYFYGVINGIDKSLMQSKIDEIVAFADIDEYIHQPLKTYSSGMKTRLGFAVAIHVSPDILILDEVLAVGDELFRRKCYAKMEEFLRKGTTILYVSHDINSIIQMCSRAIFLNDGIILAAGEPKKVAISYQNFLYASLENRTKLVSELLRLGADRAATASIEPKESAERDDEMDSSSDGLSSASMAEVRSPLKPRFLEELKSQSVIEYRNEEIDIFDPTIQTMAGERVNALLFGETYVYSVRYRSKSSKTFTHLTLGFEIKSEMGNVLSSIDANRAIKNEVKADILEPGDLIELQVEFDCLFPSGMYFTNSGLSSYQSGEQSVLNRKIDILCFKVLDSPGRIFGGLIACMKSISIRTSTGAKNYALV